MIPRPLHLDRIRRRLRASPVVAMLGARQVGKSTLAMELAKASSGECTVFDLENPRDAARLADPMLALEDLRGLVIIDEVQHAPELFRVLRVLADRPRRPARFLVLGSASPSLLRQRSESLAGRIAFHELPGLSLAETSPRRIDRLWIRGGFPRSYLARSERESIEWRRDFARTFLERDVPQLGITIAAPTLRRFWTMLAHYHGQIWNASEFGRSFGVSDTTVSRYLDVLVATFMVRRLPPWAANVKKRQVKSPKVYLRDSGVLHSLLELGTRHDVEGHPKLGASWEGFVLEEVIKQLGVEPEQCYFWATHAGAELDLLVVHGRQRLGFEFKRTASPSLTRSMRSAMADLGLTRLDVVHAGKETFALAKDVRAVAATRLTTDILWLAGSRQRSARASDAGSRKSK
jgi:predicted AAA+ superfamily ATPase